MQTPDAVKTVLRHPRRLEELLDMLGDNDLSIRGRAAATLARLAESRPESLLKAIPRLREYVNDDFDYVRWHLIYAFGEIGARVSAPAQESRKYWADIFAGMDDDSHIVRMIAEKAVERLAARHPDAVAAFFGDIKQSVPDELAKLIPAVNAE